MDHQILHQDKIFIFMSCDMRFYENLLVSLNSLKFYSKIPVLLFLGVKDNKTEHFFKNKLSNLVDDRFSFQIIIFGDLPWEKFYSSWPNTHPIESCYRLMLGNILPKFVDRVVYLDADIIVQRDIAELYFFDMRTIIGGVRDFYGIQYCQKHFKNFWISLNKYINSWVLLINLSLWRKMDIDTVIIKSLQKNIGILKFVDQDILNLVLQDHITYLDPEWNHTLLYWYENSNISKKIWIYHLLGSRKWGSFFYPNYKIRKLFYFFRGTNRSPVQIFLDIFFCYFFAYPLQFFMFFKSSLLYKFQKIYFWNYFNILFLLHPFVLYNFLQEIYKRYSKTSLKWVFFRIKEFL